MSPGIRYVLLSATVLLSAGWASAQTTDTEARLRAQLRDSTLQLRAAQDENASLRAHQQELEQQLKSAVAPGPQRVQSGSGALRTALAGRDARIAELQEQFSQTIDDLGSARQAARKAEDELRARTAEASQLHTQVAERQGSFERSQGELRSCEDKNRELVSISGELLSAYEGKGVWSALEDAEPLTQLHRVQLQSLAQDYHIKIKDRTLQAPAQQPATAAPRP